MKPTFFHDVDLIELPPLSRLLFVGLWCWSDREGRLVDNHRQIKHDILPMDDCDVDALLSDLARKLFIFRYNVAGKAFIQIRNFHKHQNPHHKEAVSEIPPYPLESSDPQPCPNLAPTLPQPCPIPDVLIPSSLFLIPDSGFPQPAVAGDPPKENKNFTHRDVINAMNSRKGGLLSKKQREIIEETDLSQFATIEAVVAHFDREFEKPFTPRKRPERSEQRPQFRYPTPQAAPVVPIQHLPVVVSNFPPNWEEFKEARWRQHPRKRTGERTKAFEAMDRHYLAGKFQLDIFIWHHQAWCESEEWTWKEGAKCPPMADWIEDFGYNYFPAGNIPGHLAPGSRM